MTPSAVTMSEGGIVRLLGKVSQQRKADTSWLELLSGVNGFVDL